MSNDLPILNQISIPTPCPASWDEMTGDEKTKHCAQCDKSVYHLSAMTAKEAAHLLQRSDGNLCIRATFRKSDNQLVTRPTRAARFLRMIQRTAVMGVALPVVTFFTGCSADDLPASISKWIAADPEVHDPSTGDTVLIEQEEALMGQVMGRLAPPEEAEPTEQEESE